jgi:SRSO17 transposase
MKTPSRPGGHQAQRNVKASSLKNIREKGCEPRDAFPSKKPTISNEDVWRFVEQVPIGGSTPIGTRSHDWQDIGTNYIFGQILPGTRKSMEPITKRIPDEDYQRLQQFITDSPWDSKATMDGTITFLKNKMASSKGVLILDDTGTRKQGRMSPGVARQYFSEIGNVANCQVTNTCVYAEPLGPTNADILIWPLGMKLYLPKEWTEDMERRERAGIPTEVEFKEKWRLALELIENARKLEVPHRAILADAWYGIIPDFRKQLRDWKEPYILGVHVNDFQVVPADTPILLPGAEGKRRGRPRTKPFLPDGVEVETPKGIAESTEDWEVVEWAKGTKGALEAKFVRKKVRVCMSGVPTDEVGWLLVEDGADGLKAFMCWGLDDLSLENLVKLTHCRWAIERYHEDIKNEHGFDHFEGRKWNGWQHHAVLTQMTFALLAWLRWKHRGSDEEVPLPTFQEVRRMLISAIVERFQASLVGSEECSCDRCKDCPIVGLVLEAS